MNPQINVDVANEAGDTPLLISARLGNVEIGTRLIQSGANINHFNNNGIIPLITAIVHGKKEFAILLLEHDNLNINAQTKAGATALYRAVSNDRADLEVVEILLMSGADPNIAGEQGLAPLGVGVLELVKRAQITGDRKKIIKLLISHGANVNHRDNFGRTALMIASLKLSMDTVDYFLTIPGIDIDIQDNEGKTALIWAITYSIHLDSHRQQLSLLLKNYLKRC